MSGKFFSFLLFMFLRTEEDIIENFNQSGYDEYCECLFAFLENYWFFTFSKVLHAGNDLFGWRCHLQEFRIRVARYGWKNQTRIWLKQILTAPFVVELDSKTNLCPNSSETWLFLQFQSSWKWQNVQKAVSYLKSVQHFHFKHFSFRISSDFHFDSSAITTLPLYQSSTDTTDHELYPLHTGAEMADGLEILMYKEKRTDIDQCKEASFTLHSPFELPKAYDLNDYCDFDYQKVITVLIHPEVIYTDESLRSVSPEKRNCFFDGERELKFFKIYTKNNCEMECLSEITQRIVNCTNFYFVRNASTRLCYMNDQQDIRFKATPKSLRDCGCLENCNSVTYKFEVRSDRLTLDYNSK